MFIPQANPYSPGSAGVSSRLARPKAGRPADAPKSGNTTLDVQSPDSCRSKTIRTGTPALTRIRFGL
jgi:hypothetical protein